MDFVYEGGVNGVRKVKQTVNKKVIRTYLIGYGMVKEGFRESVAVSDMVREDIVDLTGHLTMLVVVHVRDTSYRTDFWITRAESAGSI